MLKKLFLVAISAMVMNMAEAQYTKAKNCSLDAFDESFSRAYGHFAIDGLSLPTNKEELKRYCKDIVSNKEFSKDFGNRCLTGTSQTLLNLQVYNVDRTNKPFCAKNGKKKEDFIRWAKCGNAAKPKTKKCWDNTNEKMANIRKVPNTKSRLPLVCCEYYGWIKCMADAWKQTPDCDEDARKGYEDLIHRATVDSMNLICNRYEDDEAKCNKLYEELPKKKVKNLRPVPITYIFDVFESL